METDKIVEDKVEIKVKTKMHLGLKILIGLVVVVVVIAATAVGARAYGKYNLQQATTSAELTLQSELGDAIEDIEWEEGWISYNDKIYEYNDDILTFLVMGIDNTEEVDEIGEGIGGGQADALFLVVCDEDTNQIKVISINRNTMVDIYLYDENEYYAGSIEGQIALQYGYGDGQELSCEITSLAVSKLFYGVPIHGYAAINMGAIADLNDAIGGVEVTIDEEVVYRDIVFEAGTTELLLGERAFYYLKIRNTKEFDSVTDRTSRHMEYIQEYVSTLKTLVKEQPTIVFDLYNTAMAYMTTDVSMDKISYLAPTLLGYEFGETTIYSLEGETVTGEKYEEFYPSDESMYELMIEVFYKEVVID